MSRKETNLRIARGIDYSAEAAYTARDSYAQFSAEWKALDALAKHLRERSNRFRTVEGED